MQLFSILIPLPSAPITILSNIPTEIIVAIITGGATLGAAVISLIGKITVERKKSSSSKRLLDKGKADEKDHSQKEPDYAQMHRDRLLANPRITSLPTLDPRRTSVDFDKLYIELRLFSENSLSNEIDTARAPDPNILLQASQDRLENFAGSAKFPEEAICEVTNKRCIILGDPGAGKTSLLKYLALQSARGKLKRLPDLPIYIELYEFAATQNSNLLDYLSSKWAEDYIAPPAENISLIKEAKAEILSFLAERLEQGQVLLLLDGLGETVVGETSDEVEQTHKRVVQAIDKITKKYYRVPIVITARKAEHPRRTGLEGFTILDVLDFRPVDIKQFLVKWYGNYGEPHLADELYRILDAKKRLHALARNPLLLSNIAIVYKESWGLPEGRAKIYEECVRVLLKRWNAETRKYRPRFFQPEHKERLLEEIALYFHQQGREKFEEETLLRKIAEFLPDINFKEEQNEDVLSAIAVENGLLKEQAHKLYGFMHLTLQEYFTAKQIARDREQMNILLSHCYEPWWEEVLLMYAGIILDATPLVQKLLESDSPSPSQQNLFSSHLILAGRCIAEAPALKQYMRQQTISKLERTLQETPYTLIKQQIIEVFIGIPNGQTDEKLLRLLSDESISKDIRETIIFSLGKAGRTDLAEKLLSKVNARDIHKDIRKSIAQVLSLLGDSSIADRLSNLLINRGIEDEIRESVADTLGKLGAEGKLEKEGLAIWNMLQILSDQEISQTVRLHVAVALGRTGLPYLAPGLFAKLTTLRTRTDADIDVCMHIVDALAALGAAYRVDELLKMLSERITPTSTPTRLRIRIIDALGFLGKNCSSTDLQNILSRLRHILRDASIDADMRGHAAIALGKLGEQFTEDKFKHLLTGSDVNAFIRKSMSIALGEAKNHAYISVLLDLLENQKEELDLRIFIADALGTIGEADSSPQLPPNLRAELLLRLQRLLSQPDLDASIAGSIVDALTRIGERSIASSLLSLLSNDTMNLYTRGHIAVALTKLGEQSIVPQIVEYLANNKLDSYTRWLIAKGIENVGINPRDKRQVVSTLVSFLRKEKGIDQDVRRHIAHILEQLADDEETVHQLCEQLLESDISDDIHRALWTISRRAKMSVFITEAPDGKKIEAIKWQAYE